MPECAAHQLTQDAESIPAVHLGETRPGDTPILPGSAPSALGAALEHLALGADRVSQGRQPLRGATVHLFQQRKDPRTHPVALPIQLAVAGVFSPAQSADFGPGSQVLARDTQQRPHQTATAWAHGRQALETRGTKQPQQNGLGLVVPMVGERHRICGNAPQECRPFSTSCFLDAAPGEGLESSAVAGKPSLRRQTTHEGGVKGGLSTPQTVIHRRDYEPCLERTADLEEHVQQDHRIQAARDGHREVAVFPDERMGPAIFQDAQWKRQLSVLRSGCWQVFLPALAEGRESSERDRVVRRFDVQGRAVAVLVTANPAAVADDHAGAPPDLERDRVHQAATTRRAITRDDVDVQGAQTEGTMVAHTADTWRHPAPTVLAVEGLVPLDGVPAHARSTLGTASAAQ